MSWTTFGLPVGSAVVLVALLNTVFTVISILNYVELALHIEIDTVLDTSSLITIIASFLFTIYLWTVIVFKGRSGCLLCLWIVGNIVILLIHSTISIKDLSKGSLVLDQVNWRGTWNLIVSTVFDIYLMHVMYKAFNLMMSKNLPESNSSNGDCTLKPIGLGTLGLWKFYKDNLLLTTKTFLTLDIVFSLLHLMHAEHPFEIVASERYGVFPEQTYALNQLEDIFIRAFRIALSIMIIRNFKKKPEEQSKNSLRRITFIYITLTALSLVIFIILFGEFEELSVSLRFHEGCFASDIIYRIWIIFLLAKCIEFGQSADNNVDVFFSTLVNDENEIERDPTSYVTVDNR